MIDWIPEAGTYTVYSFDPQLANPLSEPIIGSGEIPSGDGQDRLVVVGTHILAWSATSRGYTLYRFHPDRPFSDIVQAGTLPEGFDATATLMGVQTTVPIDESGVDTPGTMAFMRKRIEHVVYLVLESRSFDNVLGWLYENGTDDVNWVHAEAPFRGADESNANHCGDIAFNQHKIHHGELSVEHHLDEPHDDPFHDTPDSIHQQWSGGYPAYQAGQPADMQGFVLNNGSKAVMGSYTPEQLPVLNGLAEHFAVSDEWFCSEASGTTTNRATLASGSAYNITASYESGSAYTNFPNTPHRQSMWKVLANNGITDWRIYNSVEWGTPPFPYTYHLYLSGQVPSVDASRHGYVQPITSFLQAAQQNALPRFSFLEPVWFDPSGLFTSYHPTGNVIPGEVGLNTIYNAIKDGDGWEKTVLVITFSKGGGLYDHVPSPRLRRAWPNDGNDGYGFDVAGSRVPAIVVSPWVTPNTVFRSDTDTPFDSTSLAATMLRWLGVPEARWGMGDRVQHAPTFETVLQQQRARRDAPTLPRPFDATYPPEAKVKTAPTIKSHWHATPATGRFTKATNWRSGKVPTGKANFGPSTQTTITFKKGSQTSVNHLVFEPGAPAYRFEFDEDQPDNPTLTITGSFNPSNGHAPNGVINESDELQTFVVTATSLQTAQAQIVFANYASAGDNVAYEVGPKSKGRSGGIISFNQQSNAGTASFTVSTGPKSTSGTTVGAEVRFNHHSSANDATFTTYGTTGTDGDTFGNVVFHNSATAANATFYNRGGTVGKGDGGNTQFYDTTTADAATITNDGGTVEHANGGDTAFDGTATAGTAEITNGPASHVGAYGGVTSFNNNWPPMAFGPGTEPGMGASAGSATIHNLAATSSGHGSGHTKFTGKFGAGTAGHATITNHGTAVAVDKTTKGGNTQFTISGKSAQPWRPTAGEAKIFNQPGDCEGAQAGYTVFAAYDFDGPIPPGPTAGSATITNLGGSVAGAPGGYTMFKNTSTAGRATLVATGGSNGGWRGSIQFSDAATAVEATIKLQGGELDTTWYGRDELDVGTLEIDGGTICCTIGDDLTTLNIVGALTVMSKTWFEFKVGHGFAAGTTYDLLKSAQLANLSPDDFDASAVTVGYETSAQEFEPKFVIVDHVLKVSFSKRSTGDRVSR